MQDFLHLNESRLSSWGIAYPRPDGDPDQNEVLRTILQNTSNRKTAEFLRKIEKLKSDRSVDRIVLVSEIFQNISPSDIQNKIGPISTASGYLRNKADYFYSSFVQSVAGGVYHLSQIG
ncbi:MAG: hypothetical protein AAFO73_11545, partial [Pseudomonadota bacterium]